jgi:hypothetical protein
VVFSNGIFNGTINANAGTIGGINISAGYLGTTLDVGKGWEIAADGTATFRNVNVSGKITSTIFEYDKVQTVAGSMLIRPAVYFKSYEVDNNVLYIIVDSDSIPSEFAVNSLVKFGNSFTDNCVIYKISSIDATNKKLGLTPTNGSISEDTSYTTQNIILHMGGAEEKVIGLGLNASINSAVLPAQSFSIIELGNETYNPRLILGKIPGNVIAEFKGVEAIQADTYGLYADEVYLIGEIHATAGKIGDIEIANGGLSYIQDEEELWYINDDGVYFGNGIFNGVINANEGMIGSVEIANGGLRVEVDGNLKWEITPDRVFFNEGTFNGIINATSGKIGDIELEDGVLKGYRTIINEVTGEKIIVPTWEINSERIKIENGEFYGYINASDGVFTGTINASSGFIGGIEITENSISSNYTLNNGWKLTSNGNAYLNNGLFSGKIFLLPIAIVDSIEEQNGHTYIHLNADHNFIQHNTKNIKIGIPTNNYSTIIWHNIYSAGGDYVAVEGINLNIEVGSNVFI